MNKVILVGRITKDPELKRTNSDIPYVQFSIAVNRTYKDRNGERQADFINCVAWRQVAELLARFIRKGNQVGIEGNIQTRNYDDANGIKHYITEVICDQIHFLESKRQDDQSNSFQSPSYQNNNNYSNNYQNNYQKPNNQNYNKQEQENPFADIDSDINISSDDLPF